MSDRCWWLDEWCPECRVAPGTRCRRYRWDTQPRYSPSASAEAAPTSQTLLDALEQAKVVRYERLADREHRRRHQPLLTS